MKPLQPTGQPVTVDVPARFWEDHEGRGLHEVGSAVVVKRLARTVRVSLDSEALNELLSDAKHYAGEAMSEWVEGRAVIASARATVRVLNVAAWDWPDGPERRAVLGHQREPHVPGYCTCGEMIGHCTGAPLNVT